MKLRNPSQRRLDALDQQILRRIELCARMQNQELAVAIGLSPSGTLHRVKRLEQSGIIRRYIADIDEHLFEGWVVLWAELSLTPKGRSSRANFEALLQTRAEIVEARRIIGRADYLLRVCARELSAWTQLLEHLDPRGDLVHKAQVQVEDAVAKRFSGLPQFSAPRHDR